MKTYYTVYKITNLVNNKYYIGIHYTDDLLDNYMGSGVRLKESIKKYGVTNFEKKYIEIFDNPEDMVSLEEQLVTYKEVNDRNCYNLVQGGKGWSLEHSVLGGARIKWLYENDKEWVKEQKEKQKAAIKRYFENGGIGSFSGKSHTEDTLEKMRSTHKKNKHSQGKNNSQFGKKWIYNNELKVSKRVLISELDEFYSQGWKKGRVCDFDLKLQKESDRQARKKKKLDRSIVKQRNVEKLWNDFNNGEYRSVADFKRKTNYQYSFQHLCSQFKKFIDEYDPIPGVPFSSLKLR